MNGYVPLEDPQERARLGSELISALTIGDEHLRAQKAHRLIDAGADVAVTRSGQSTLSVLMGAHRYLGAEDAPLFARLVDEGADVNFRERRGDLIMKLVIRNIAVDEEQRRPIYDALFACPLLDLSKPSVLSAPDRPIMWWLEMNYLVRPHKLAVLAPYLGRYREQHPELAPFPGIDEFPKAKKPLT